MGRLRGYFGAFDTEDITDPQEGMEELPECGHQLPGCWADFQPQVKLGMLFP